MPSMHQNVLFVLLALVLSLVSASPAFAVYSLTQGTPNQVTITLGNSTGGLSVQGPKVTTGGNGVPAGSPRGLESQHPLVVSGNYLFTVNTGSGSVSMFSINPTDPTQLTLLDTKSSGGDWPLSLTVYAPQSWVCVANGGPTNGIRCYSYNSAGLTILPWDRFFGLNLTLPPVFHTGPAQVSFIPDGSGIVVAIKSNNPPLFLWTINNGQLSANAINTTSFGNVPFGFAFDQNDNTKFVLTDPAPTAAGLSGIDVITVTSGTSPSITVGGNYTLIPNQHAACWIEQSALNSHFYVMNSGSDNITEVSRSGNTLTLINNYALPVAATDMGIGKVGNAEYLFADSGGSQLFVLSIAAGNAHVLQNVSLNATTTYGGGVAVYVVGSSTNTTSTTSTSSTGASTTSTSTSTTGSTTSSASTLFVGFGLLFALILALF